MFVHKGAVRLVWDRCVEFWGYFHPVRFVGRLITWRGEFWWWWLWRLAYCSAYFNITSKSDTLLYYMELRVEKRIYKQF